MKIALTGHTNIEKFYNKKYIGEKYDEYSYNEAYKEILFKLRKSCKIKNIDFNSLILISGMARGADEIFADIAMNNNLKLILSVPHSTKWHKERIYKKDLNVKIAAIKYDEILKYKNIIDIIEVFDENAENNYSHFTKRNQNMVDISDFVISYKKYESIGTNDCIQRAKEVNKYLDIY